MKAWLLPAFSGVASLQAAEVPDPVPGPGQILLHVHYAALNPADAYLALGQYPAKPTFPHILGRDGVGKVLAVAGEPSKEMRETIQVGDVRAILRSEVGVSRAGTLAEKVVVDAAYTVAVPQGWTEEQAGAAPLVYVTAWQALSQWGELPEKAVILITGASGGVGSAAIQLAHAMGYRVVALSRGKAKLPQLQAVGADWVLDIHAPDWREQLEGTLGKYPVQLAIDNLGGEYFPRVLEVMALHGRISVVGRLAGPVPNFNTAALLFRRLKVGGVAIATYTNAEAREVWENILQTLSRTNAKPLIDKVFPFAQVPAAFARLAQGPMGKVVVRI
jgi:NADPH2:quinone reductase